MSDEKRRVQLQRANWGMGGKGRGEEKNEDVGIKYSVQVWSGQARSPGAGGDQ
jgi:hypothetical protein